MTYFSITLIVLIIGLLGAGLVYLCPFLVGREQTNSAHARTETDAKTSASLFNTVRETLFAHANKLSEFNAVRVEERGGRDTSALDDLRRSSRQASDSLEANGQKLDSLLKNYGNLYQSERGRIESYAQQTKELDRQLAVFENDADGSNKVLLQLVREMVQENSQLRARVSSCQEQVSELIVQSVKSNREARTDSLTRLPNRRAWDERLESLDGAASTSVALVDVDDFKLINDRYGHAAGDGMLNVIGTIFRSAPQISAYRIGGDEFALIIRRSPSHDDDRIVEQIRSRIQSSTLQFDGDKIKTTVSVGVAQVTCGESIQSVLFRADNALYAAKDAGGNQVQLNRNATPAVDAADKVLEHIEAE